MEKKKKKKKKKTRGETRVFFFFFFSILPNFYFSFYPLLQLEIYCPIWKINVFMTVL